jgi:uncharacterized RDD family membrane protein YckC
VLATDPALVEYATWRKRLLAWLADIAICGGGLLLVDVVIAVVLALVISSTNPGSWGEVVGALSVFGFVLVFPLYLVFFHGGKNGQTPGKRRLEIAVRTASTYGRVTYPRALLRSYLPALFWALIFVAPILGFGPLATFAALLLLLDALWPLWNRRRQALHDKLAGTVVLQTIRDRELEAGERN